MVYCAVFLWVLVYANDGYSIYTPKSRRLNARLARYMAFLKAWTKKRLKPKIRWIVDWLNSRNRNRELNKRQAMAAKYWEQDASQPNYNNKDHQPTDLQAWEVILAMETLTNKVERSTILDTDSKAIGIDNRCSAYLSGYVEDFQGPLEATNRVIKGFGGTQTTDVSKGTAFIRLEDDGGKVHTFKLPNSYYVPGCKVRLLSPQHWAQELRKQQRGPAYSKTTEDHVLLLCKDFIKTIKLDQSTNVATCRSAPGYDKFIAFCFEAGFDGDKEPLSYEAQWVSDDEGDSDEDSETSTDNRKEDETRDKQLGPSTPHEGIPIVEETEVELEQRQLSLEAELLR